VNVDVVSHLPLVYTQARWFVKKIPPQVEFDELVSAGTIGLIEAARKFDPTRGIEFSTYAHPRIRGAICDELRSRDHLSRSHRAQLKTTGGRDPLAGVPLDAAPPQMVEPTQEQDAIRGEIRRFLFSAMRRLRPRDRRVVILRYWGDKTLTAIASDLGVGESRVCQIDKRAIAKLRSVIIRQSPFLVPDHYS